MDKQAGLDRGKLLGPERVAKEILGGQRSAQWVRRNVPNKIRLGASTVMWYERDVLDWIESRRERF